MKKRLDEMDATRFSGGGSGGGGSASHDRRAGALTRSHRTGTGHKNDRQSP